MSFNVYGAESINVIVDGINISFSDATPQVISGRTMVPIRAIFEAIGADVIWESEEEKITAVKGKDTLIMQKRLLPVDDIKQPYNLYKWQQVRNGL